MATSTPDSKRGRQGAQHPVPYEMGIVFAVLAPLLTCGLLSLPWIGLANTSAALILVLVIVAAASTGYRSAGIISAISAGLWFDFFLTTPYLTFSVTNAADVETFIVLVLLGVAINEIIQWGRRYQNQLRDRDAYLHALLSISATPPNETSMLEAVGSHLLTMLDLDTWAWVDVVDPLAPRLDRDGQIRDHDRRLRVDTNGLPTDTSVALPVRPDDPQSPGFMLTAATHIARPSLRQRRLAGALADHVDWALRAQLT
jgi:hypothetical protein